MSDKPRGAVRLPPKTPVEPPRPVSTKRGAEHHKVDTKAHRDNWLRNHWLVANSSLRKLRQTPLASFMTIAVLAIALTLPGFLFSGLANLQKLTVNWDGDARLSLYLASELTDEQADQFGRSLMLRDDVLAVDLISRDQGLLDFKRYSGFGDILDSLQENPLPAVIVLLPKEKTIDKLGLLRASLADMPEVSDVVLDMEWLQRFGAMVKVVERLVFVVGTLLGLVVLLVVGNTIKVSIESRRSEIVVSKLVGATDAWVRRPFLYTGFWYGCIGAVLALFIVQVAWLMLEKPTLELAALYRSQFELEGLGLNGSLTLLFASIFLGWIGAWLSVYRHLREIEPR